MALDNDARWTAQWNWNQDLDKELGRVDQALCLPPMEHSEAAKPADWRGGWGWGPRWGGPWGRRWWGGWW